LICPKCGREAGFVDEKVLPNGILKSHHRCRKCDAVFVGIVETSKPYVVAKPRIDRVKHARNELIRRRVEAGETQAAVALAFGITKQRVGQIIGGGKS